MTAATSKDYVPYDVFLRGESAGEDHHEWVDGVVYAMRRGSPEHGRLTNRVTGRVLTPLLDEGCESFSSDTPVFIEAAQHHTYADASLVCGSLVTRTVHDKNGQSIGEAIVNPYKKNPSFEQYVLVSQDERRIEVRTRDGDGWTSEIARAGEAIRIHGREVSVDAIYA